MNYPKYKKKFYGGMIKATEAGRTQDATYDSLSNISDRFEQFRNITANGKYDLESIVEQQGMAGDTLNKAINNKYIGFITISTVKRKIEIEFL